VERVDLTRLRKAERQRWRSGDEWDDSAPKIAVGQFTDGRWYVRQYGPATRAYGTARRWMRTLGGQWVEA
jgi:hypothetical protein